MYALTHDYDTEQDEQPTDDAPTWEELPADAVGPF